MSHVEIDPALFGHDLLARPLLNKGTAFTEVERDRFRLHGLLPPHVGTLDEQVARRLRALRACDTDLERYAFMRDLQDVNETLFYALLSQHAEELLPIVYTPTVGTGCQRFSEVWRRPRGVFLSYPNRARMRDILANPAFDATRVIVVSDGERILGLGDQGAGGMGIPIGKLSLYTACAGIHPSHTLPILLDVGTDNADRLADPLYIGWRSPRIRGAEYEAYVDDFVQAVKQRWPGVLLQWEDFAGHNAGAFLARYRDALCTFNDDIQGTAAVATGALLAAIHKTQVPLAAQTIVFQGFGAAGTGIADLIVRAMMRAGLSEAAARARIWAVDRDGLLVDGMPHTAMQRPFLRPASDPRGDLAATVAHARPTVLIGVSGQTGAFTERLVRTMAAHAARPVIFPLSNPTSRSEAIPADLAAWTDGRAIVGTGSPFPDTPQTNNSYIFPGVGLGVLAARAPRVTDAMFMAAAETLAELSPARRDPAAPLLPHVSALRTVAIAVARAVAQQAVTDGLVPPIPDLDAAIADHVWDPVYREYRAKSP